MKLLQHEFDTWSNLDGWIYYLFVLACVISGCAQRAGEKDTSADDVVFGHVLIFTCKVT